MAKIGLVYSTEKLYAGDLGYLLEWDGTQWHAGTGTGTTCQQTPQGARYQVNAGTTP